MSEPTPDAAAHQPNPPAQPQPVAEPSAYAPPAAYPPAPAAYPPAPQYPASGAYRSAPPYGAQSAYPSAPAYGGGYAQQPGTNTLAIVSLIASIVGFTVIPFIGSVVGVITGHMALSQIKRTQEQGRGLAIAGLIVGYVGIGLTLLSVVLLLALVPAFVTLITELPRSV
ncbi:DUF4190 domain-containing protein [Microbacterium sp. BWT-B31]|uniref:DUF4190 domain-containing protein n=1 Tax=Microbacterium sp. BWT-B31 TaxID=3232072 RepID=UPI0035297270